LVQLEGRGGLFSVGVFCGGLTWGITHSSIPCSHCGANAQAAELMGLNKLPSTKLVASYFDLMNENGSNNARPGDFSQHVDRGNLTPEVGEIGRE